MFHGLAAACPHDESGMARLPTGQSSLPAYQALVQGTLEIDGVDCRGVPVGAAAEPIKGRTWVLLPRVDQEEVLGDLRRRALKTTLASLGILWAAATILLFFLRRHAHRDA